MLMPMFASGCFLKSSVLDHMLALFGFCCLTKIKCSKFELVAPFSYNVDPSQVDSKIFANYLGEKHQWGRQDPDHDLRAKYKIPTDTAFDQLNSKDQKSTVSKLLTWADFGGVPNNSQIREMLGCLTLKAADSMLRETQTKWTGIAVKGVDLDMAASNSTLWLHSMTGIQNAPGSQVYVL